MENQHRLIKGYRDLTDDEIILINEIKVHAEETNRLCEKVIKLNTDAYKALCATIGDVVSVQTENALETLDDACRWHDDARKQLQVGYMKLVRSVAKPQGF